MTGRETRFVVIRRPKRHFLPLEIGTPPDATKLLEIENDLDDASRERANRERKDRERKETLRGYCPDPEHCKIHVHNKPSPSTSNTAEHASTAPVQDGK